MPLPQNPHATPCRGPSFAPMDVIGHFKGCHPYKRWRNVENTRPVQITKTAAVGARNPQFQKHPTGPPVQAGEDLTQLVVIFSENRHGATRGARVAPERCASLRAPEHRTALQPLRPERIDAQGPDRPKEVGAFSMTDRTWTMD